ncbi:PAS domain S-box protein [Desulfococcus sp.]|uniref:PAS domain-containing sensor histidine kinase n=1 Tax=Desulfococcus sp. TaxID=2025834 RepID=UPI0035936647
MTQKKRHGHLRTRAKALLKDRLSEVSEGMLKDPAGRLREFMLHQIELELRNDELCDRQSALAQSRDEHRDFFEFAPIALVSMDRAGALIEANRAALDLFRAEKPALCIGRLHRFIRPGDRNRFNTHLERVFEGGARQICEIEMRKTDGAVCHVQLISLRHESGDAPRCQTAVIDISFRKRIEEEMEDRIDGRTRELNALNMQLEQEIEWRKQTEERLDSELNFRTVIEETIPVGICVFDTNGRLLHANNHLCDMLGFSRAELLDTYPPYPFWPAESLLSRMAELKNFIEKDDVIENVVREYRTKTGEPLWGLTSRIKMKDQRGQSYGILGSVFDITPRKKMEEELRLSERKLRTLSVKLMEAGESERERISKELHDSVGSALTAVQFAMERKLSEMGGNPCGKKTCLEDILPMVNTIADEVRRISKNLHPSVLEDLGIKAALRAYGRQFQKLYKETVLEQHIDMDEAAAPGYLKLLIYRIVQESMANAAKHGRAGRILLSLRQVGPRIELEVRDDGRGFDPNDVQSRAAEALGLASMKERTEHAGGAFEVVSAPGAGTRIRAVWPLDPPS